MKTPVKTVLASFFALAGLAAFAANDEWPVATQATTQSCWRAAADGSFSEAANWQYVEASGGKWGWTGATGSVPVISSTEIVNGYLFNKESDYAVSVDKPATLNYLYVGQDHLQNQPGKVTVVVTNNMTVANADGNFTAYRPECGDVATVARRALHLDGPCVEMIVRDGANLTIRPDFAASTWRDSAIGQVKNGARLLVTNATLTLDKLRSTSYDSQHLHFDTVGTLANTSTLETVDAAVVYTGMQDSSYGFPWKFKEYSRGIFTDSVLDMPYMWDLRTSAANLPAPEILLDGDTVYKWNRTSYGTLFNGGHVVFDDNAVFTNVTATGANVFIGPELDGGTMHLELCGNSTFSLLATSGNSASPLRIGLGNAKFRKTTTCVTIDTTGRLCGWDGIQVGYKWGKGRLELKKGTIFLGGWSNIALGFTDNNASHDNQCVTGRLDIAGGVLDANVSNQATVRGLIVGAAYDLRTADATDYYSYGEVNVTDGIVSNRSDVWIGTGLAKGVFRQTGGEFLSNGHLVLGAGGGEGEMYILGGSYTIQDAWARPGTVTGNGAVYIGGVSQARMGVISRTKNLPATFPHGRPGKGYLCVSNAPFFVGSYGENVGTDIGSCGTGLLELKSGAFYDTPYLAMTNGANSELKFTLAGDAAPQMRVREKIWVGPKAKLVVDARGYTGGEKWIQLVKFVRDKYPNQYWQGWGFSRNGVPASWQGSDSVCDRFDADCIETLGDVAVVQVTDSAAQGRAAGIWAHIKRGLVIMVR